MQNLVFLYNIHMYRKTPLIENEHYHIFSRGVEKRKIFLNIKDYRRFVALLYIMNQNTSFRMIDFQEIGLGSAASFAIFVIISLFTVGYMLSMRLDFNEQGAG